MIALESPQRSIEGAIGDVKIRLNQEENPKTAGMACYERFNRYRDGMTVQEAIREGVEPADIKWDLRHGFIALTT